MLSFGQDDPGVNLSGHAAEHQAGPGFVVTRDGHDTGRTGASLNEKSRALGRTSSCICNMAKRLPDHLK